VERLSHGNQTRPCDSAVETTAEACGIMRRNRAAAAVEEHRMDFGYFTLSDNAYAGNPRDANRLVLDIVDEAIHAESLGMRSAWIGEHHFSTLGVTSCPDLMLAHVAARTTRIRLAPAVTVLPLHHPIRVAEQWATLDLLSGGRVDFATGRGYDRREYAPFAANFEENAAVFAEGCEILQRLWAGGAPVSYDGEHFKFDGVTTTPRPVQSPIPCHVASFSLPSMELAARLGWGLVVAAGAASAMHGGLARTAELYREACAKQGTRPARLVTSYFIHFADTPAEERAARERQLRYHKECTSLALPGDPRTAPANYRYFTAIVNKYQTMRPEDFTDDAVLIGNAAKIVDVLKAKVEAAGFDEAILYFNLGLKPHAQVKEEMARFMAEVAPQFRDARRRLAR
jgi:alkanesulfonate monooxygenase SsuD/methylene tetrahydromethanopterin reductase-like flavin-dependent oxidoreductase (luciferase family)